MEQGNEGEVEIIVKYGGREVFKSGPGVPTEEGSVLTDDKGILRWVRAHFIDNAALLKHLIGLKAA